MTDYWDHRWTPWEASPYPGVEETQIYVESGDMCGEWIGTGVDPKHAKLMAAAPDMAEALQALINVHNDGPFSVTHKAAIAQARDALEKSGISDV